MEPDMIKADSEHVHILTSEQAWHYRIVPAACSEDAICFLSDLPADLSRCEELELVTGKKCTIVHASSAVINEALARYYRMNNGSSAALSFDGAMAGSEFIAKIIAEASSIKASDIHLERAEDAGRLRMRVDGKLIERGVIPAEKYPLIINQVKIAGKLDIAEKRLPQDGRILIKDQRSNYDIRVSVLPSIYGEKVVMRLLRQNSFRLSLNDTGMTSAQLEHYYRGINKPQGLVLISGPTGSGKTTTLYATLKHLNTPSRNIVTIEDPVEYTLNGITQVQVKESIGYGFSNALRTFLRQDPDIIMVGEIRDRETAEMAVRAALTGHLVISTIHTPGAWGTIARLADMGIPRYLIASVLTLSVAQRLVRVLCIKCKGSNSAGSEATGPSGLTGCEQCHFTGFTGRSAIYEVLPVTADVRAAITNGLNAIANEFYPSGVLKDAARRMVEAGVTTHSEAFSIIDEEG